MTFPRLRGYKANYFQGLEEKEDFLDGEESCCDFVDRINVAERDRGKSSL